MKILSREQIRQADAFTIENEPIASIDLMERASAAFAEKFKLYVGKEKKIFVFCGTGNNGGDGLAVSRLLLNTGYRVYTGVVVYSDNFTGDFKANKERLKKTSGSQLFYIEKEDDLPEMNNSDVIIDALWGSGLTRPITGFAAAIIGKLNNTGAKIFSVDIPSGLFCDEHNFDDVKVKASHTISFQFPKLSFFMPENEDCTGTWEVADIGLHPGFISQLDTSHFYLLEDDVRLLIKERKNFAHKGHFGHALIAAGSYGKMGAAVLGSRACLRSGAGLVTAYVPSCGYEIIQMAAPSAMTITDPNKDYLTVHPELKAFNVIGIGPGLGTKPETASMLAEMLRIYPKPMVLDADAINILAAVPEMIRKVIPLSVLTPHIGEFERLVGKSVNHYERLEKLKVFCSKYNLVVVLKGAYTAIATPKGRIFFNATGNPGMATGGSGDVLTGLITGLMAQGYTSDDAAKLGVYLHGLAGDIAAEKFSRQGMTAEDIIECIPPAFKQLQNV